MKMLGSVLVLVVGVMACDQNKSSITTQTETKTSGNGKTTEIKTKTEIKADSNKTTQTKTIETKTTETKRSDTATAVGIAECDDYLVKMTECTKKMSAAAAVSTTESLATLKKGWKEGASTPQGRAAVANACDKALDTARREYASLGCTF